MHGVPDPEEIEALVERINEGPWKVTDWDYSTGAYAPSEIEIDAEWNPTIDDRETIGEAKSVIAGLEDQHEHGAPVNRVLDELGEELGIEYPSAVVDALRQSGEIYEPVSDYYRTT